MKAYKLRKCIGIAAVVSIACLIAVLGSKTLAPDPQIERWPSSFDELVELSEEELGQIDIALVNLLCAEQLPGAETINIRSVLAVIDEWAGIVQASERKYAVQFHRNANRYDHSYAKFRAVNLALTLKQDLGCRYNSDLVASGVMADLGSTRFFRDSKDLFLHGFTMDRKGSCASLPVLMIAVGRRCGYPIYLVTSKGHLFCRWDDGEERFNLETACEGVDCKPDSYYRHWPHAFDREEELAEKYLRTLNPTEELGVMAQIRAACLEENNRWDEAAEAYKVALRAFPDSIQLKAYLNRIEEGDR